MNKPASARRGFVALMSGAAAGQIISIGATPIISRLYGPESFGTYSVILSLAAIFAPVATLKFDAAMLLPGDDDGARRLLRMGAIGVLTTSVLAFSSIVLVGAAGFNTGLTDVLAGALFVAIIICVTSLFTLLSQAALRRRDYSNIAKRSVTQQAGTVVTQLVGAAVTTSFLGLATGRIAGLACGYIPIIRSTRTFLARPRTGSFRSTFRHYWRYPLLFAPSALMNSIGTQAPVIVIATIFGAGPAGELAMANRILLIPTALLGTAVGQVFAAEASRRIRQQAGGNRSSYLRLSARLALLAAFLIAGTFICADALFVLFLGSEWSMAATYAKATVVSVGLGLIASPLSRVFTLYGKAFLSLAVDTTRIVLLAVTVGVSVYCEFDAAQAMALIYSGQAINYILTWMLGWFIVSKEEEKYATS